MKKCIVLMENTICSFQLNIIFLKPKPGKGSAIFLHITKNFKLTAGCIALKESDFLILLKLINKKTKINIK